MCTNSVKNISNRMKNDTTISLHSKVLAGLIVYVISVMLLNLSLKGQY